MGITSKKVNFGLQHNPIHVNLDEPREKWVLGSNIRLESYASLEGWTEESVKFGTCDFLIFIILNSVLHISAEICVFLFFYKKILMKNCLHFSAKLS